MTIINTADLTPESDLPPMETYWIYNGLDTTITFEVFEKLSAQQTSPEVQLIYNFERAMQAPALDMMLRGFKIDEAERAQAIETIASEQTLLEERFNQLTTIIWGRPLNARSPTQLKDFFSNHLRIPIPITRKKGEEKESLDRKALEKLYDQYFYSKPIISFILAIRDRTKTLGTLRSGIDSDGRIRTSYNVAGTETGRWSSSENVWGTGTNLQNITEKLRRIMIADQGYKLAYIDLEQAEARDVALLLYWTLFQKEAWACAFNLEIPAECLAKEYYLDACESGDLHTAVAILTWPNLPWTDDLKTNKKIADDASKPFYRDFTFRDIAKRLGHGSNYRGSPFGIAQQVGKIEPKIVEAFQEKYFTAFPLEHWHKDVIEKVQLYGQLTTPLGRRRQFFGHRSADATHREAIAFQPQSMVGDLLNLGLYRIWHHYRNTDDVQLLAQIHDAVVIQYKDKDPSFEQEVISTCQNLLSIPVTLGARTMVIPSDCKVGWNFSKADPNKKLFADGNPDGLIGYTGHDTRTRKTQASLLDRLIR